jgi:hypothetical protein
MQDFEKLGVFYLGRETGDAAGKLLLYDSRDLVTHAVCVGMTGSGKTGLCIALLEEAAMDGIPAVVIDPKGDLANLLLTFPDLAPADFLPWINEDDARRKGLSPDDYAGQQAAAWKKGLADWGQDGARIRRLREAADFAIYTPGSSAGIPVSILRSFDPPGRAILEDADLLRERVATTVTGLLELLGIDADPLQSREHVLLCAILENAWQEGRGVDIAGLIEAVQEPPVRRVGVFDIETFFPAADRRGLAMKLNTIIAAPAMKGWIDGEPIDLDRMLRGSRGKPRIAIFSIAHLADRERMFFVTLLLLHVLAWTRAQSGTTSLRALLYMDEIFGYLPPVANPPSKVPLLTLLKQARAFGVGVVLATQNPVDLDYKGLANTGTWFIGRLQTERDRERVLAGLEGAAAASGGTFDRKSLAALLSRLGNRVFLMNNVHDDAPVLFESRWAMSYLRGPLTRDQVRILMDPLRPALSAPAEAGPIPRAAPGAGLGAAPASAESAAPGGRPALSASIPQFFVPERAGGQGSLAYEARCLGIATLYYADSKSGLSEQREVAFAAEVSPQLSRPLWDEAVPLAVRDRDLRTDAAPGARFGPVPAQMQAAAGYADWGRDFREWLYRTQSVTVLRSPAYGTCSHPGETEADFRVRLRQSGRESRDSSVDAVRRRYQSRIASLQERLRRAEQASLREKQQADQQKLQTAISVGAAILGAFVGGGRRSYTVGRATTAARGAGRIIREQQDIARARENVAVLAAELEQLQAEMERELAGLRAAVDPMTEELESLTVAPKKSDIAVRVLALGWLPWRTDAKGGLTPAF